MKCPFVQEDLKSIERFIDLQIKFVLFYLFLYDFYFPLYFIIDIDKMILYHPS